MTGELVVFIVLLVAYLGSFLAHLAYFYYSEWLRVAKASDWIILSLHTVFLILRISHGYLPIFALADAILFLAWFLLFSYILLDRSLKLRSLGVFVIPVIAGLLFYAAFLPKSPVSFVSISHWLIFHVFLALISYGAFSFAFAASIMYILQERQLKSKVFQGIYFRLPSLAVLERLSYHMTLLGTPLLGISLVFGAIWANVSWGSYWSWDPKQNWTLVTLIIYSTYLLGYNLFQWRGKRAAYILIGGYVSVLVNLLLVNWLLTTLHVF